MNDYVKGCLSYDPPVYDKMGNRIDAVQLINEMRERIAELEAALSYVHKDLLLRAETDDDGITVVSVGSRC